MGFDARQVRGMSLWEFGHAAEGWAQANGNDKEIAEPDEERHVAALMAVGAL
jgi:hypothetical protein